MMVKFNIVSITAGEMKVSLRHGSTKDEFLMAKMVSFKDVFGPEKLGYKQ